LNSPFDDAKYQALLEGLEVAVINFSDVLKSSKIIRLDPNFFLLEKLIEAIAELNPAPLSQICGVITQGPNPQFVEDGIPCLTGRNIVANKISFEGSDRVAPSDFKFFKSFWLREDDILITLKGAGSTGKVALYAGEEPAMFSRNIGLIRVEKNAQPSAKVVYAFLASKYGQELIDRGVTGGTGQLTLPTTYLKFLNVPTFEQKLSNLIANCIASSNADLIQSNDLYTQAETLLLETLNLRDWQPPQPHAYESTLSAAFAAKRLDAEYFQPQHAALLEHLQKHAPRVRRVRDFAAHCDRGQQPEYCSAGELAVVNSRHILENGLDYDNFERTDAKYWNDLRFHSARIEKNDILIYTTGGFAKKPGRTAIYLEDEPALASNHVNILRVSDENPLYVGVVLNSMIGRIQASAASTGSIQQEIYPSDIADFVVPFVGEKIEVEIAAQVEAGHAARRRAKGLLEAAKRAVEIAIEDDEAAALEFLVEQV